MWEPRHTFILRLCEEDVFCFSCALTPLENIDVAQGLDVFGVKIALVQQVRHVGQLCFDLIYFLRGMSGVSAHILGLP